MKQTILVNGCSRLFILHLVCLFSLSAVCRFTYTSVSIVAAFGMTHWNEGAFTLVFNSLSFLFNSEVDFHDLKHRMWYDTLYRHCKQGINNLFRHKLGDIKIYFFLFLNSRV